MLAVYQIGLDANKNFKNREVYNLFDWFGDNGGIQGIIFVLSAGVSSIFSSTLVSIQKAELIYKYLPTQNRAEPQTNDQLRAADELRLEKFARLIKF